MAAILNADERERRGANGRIHIQNTYSWIRTADRYLAIYDNLHRR